MSKCCKYAKWFPHNWLCLKGLSIVFYVLFYITLAFLIYQDISIIFHPGLTGGLKWLALLGYTLQNAGVAIGFLTIAKVLHALRKIKQAVAPCCCEGNAEKEETK
ncbi:MAG: hypothetical protein J6V32_03925 [Elusimicrobiaceae bacterium]|nr:hypothetical protein [Elusimicrobiaceae bacterium]